MYVMHNTDRIQCTAVATPFGVAAVAAPFLGCLACTHPQVTRNPQVTRSPTDRVPGVPRRRVRLRIAAVADGRCRRLIEELP